MLHLMHILKFYAKLFMKMQHEIHNYALFVIKFAWQKNL
jgi:hypothetical protein